MSTEVDAPVLKQLLQKFYVVLCDLFCSESALLAKHVYTYKEFDSGFKLISMYLQTEQITVNYYYWMTPMTTLLTANFGSLTDGSPEGR